MAAFDNVNFVVTALSGGSSINGASGWGALALLIPSYQTPAAPQTTTWSLSGNYDGNPTTIYIRSLSNTGSSQPLTMLSATSGGSVTIPQYTILIAVGVCFVSSGTTYTFTACSASPDPPSGSSLSLTFSNPTDGSGGQVIITINAQGLTLVEIPS